jgi:hypothetical protein
MDVAVLLVIAAAALVVGWLLSHGVMLRNLDERLGRIEEALAILSPQTWYGQERPDDPEPEQARERIWTPPQDDSTEPDKRR